MFVVKKGKEKTGLRIKYKQMENGNGNGKYYNVNSSPYDDAMIKLCELTNISWRNILHNPLHYFANLQSTFMARDNHSNFSKKLGVVFKRLAGI